MIPCELYKVLASGVSARLNCIRANNQEWKEFHESRILEFVKEHMPHGSGFDSGTEIDFNESNGDKLVFHTSYHHMNDAGYYDGWSNHTVTVTPSFITGMNVKVSGRDRNEIKDYVATCFHDSLMTNVSRNTAHV